MTSPLEPMRVELSDIRFWLRESVALFRRKPLALLGLSLCYFFICYKISMTAYITFVVGLLICQSVLSISIEIARAADHSENLSLWRCYGALKNSVFVICLLGLLYLLIWLVSERLASQINFVVPHNDYTGTTVFEKLQWLYPGTIGLFVVYIGTMVTTLWFLLPLCALHRIGIGDAVRLAKHGERVNFFVVMAASYIPFFIFFLLFLLSELVLLVALFCVPLFGVYLYVSYRHVYLGRRENEPARISQTAAVTQSA